MGIPRDEAVEIRHTDTIGDATIVTINCPGKIGLGCDLCRVVLLFGLSILKADMSTDGRWCYIVLWVAADRAMAWDLLKERLVELCPVPAPFGIDNSYLAAAGLLDDHVPTQPQVFLLKLCCYDRMGLLHDVTRMLCEIELTIMREKVSTTPDGESDGPFLHHRWQIILHTKSRREEAYERLQTVLGDSMTSCEIESATEDTQGHSRTATSSCEVDLFVVQPNGKKIIDKHKKSVLCSRLRIELRRPLHVAVVNRGPDAELLVANPVEVSRKDRPLVLHDITLVLKNLEKRIFLAEIGRHMVDDREWEVYRVHLGEDDRNLSCSARSRIVDGVTDMLMGWDRSR